MKNAFQDENAFLQVKPLISKIGLDRATHMPRGAKNEAREIQSAPYWSDHFRDIVVIGC